MTDIDTNLFRKNQTSCEIQYGTFCVFVDYVIVLHVEGVGLKFEIYIKADSQFPL
jgi:hypothetical protein